MTIEVKPVPLLTTLAVAACAAEVSAPEEETTYEIVGARWFNGTGFVERTMYVVG